MTIMECTRILCGAICFILLTLSVNSQNNFDQNISPDKIYFFEDQTQQPIPSSWLISEQQKHALAAQRQVAIQQPLAYPWQQSRQQVFLNRPQANQLIANPQTVSIEQAEVRLLTTEQSNLTKNKVVDQPRTTNMMTDKKIIRLDGKSVALTSFSLNVMKLVNQQQKNNIVVSPHSIATLLALLQQGATGATLDQLSVALQMTQQGSAAAFKAYSDDVQKRTSHNILRTANNIFLAEGFKLNADFRAIALRDFRSDITPTNFALAETTQEINRWVARQTDNKIQNLISPDSLGINTQMVLVNAMYFKGLWDIPFRRQATTPGEFLLSSGKVIKAQFMQTRRFFKTGMDSFTADKVIVLPFERDEYSLMVILPNSLSSISNVLSSLTAARLEEYLNFPHLEARLELPKFSIKADTDLSDVLMQMGISKLFGDSELSSIGTFQDNRSPRVSNAVHSAALTIDEEGGSAAASTAFAVVALSNDEPSVVFRANRPFLAVIWDNKAMLPLFVAKIEDPTS